MTLIGLSNLWNSSIVHPGCTNPPSEVILLTQTVSHPVCNQSAHSHRCASDDKTELPSLLRAMLLCNLVHR